MTLKLGPITQYSKLLLFYRLNYSMTGFIPILNQENNSTEKLNISHNLSEKFNLEKKINISDTLSQPSLLQSIVERYKKSLHLFSTVENLKLQHPSLLNYIVETKILEASFVSINDLKNRFEYLKIRPATPAGIPLLIIYNTFRFTLICTFIVSEVALCESNPLFIFLLSKIAIIFTYKLFFSLIKNI
jgi:hypothetical protein